jgi:hypothetical protein
VDFVLLGLTGAALGAMTAIWWFVLSRLGDNS